MRLFRIIIIKATLKLKSFVSESIRDLFSSRSTGSDCASSRETKIASFVCYHTGKCNLLKY